MTEFYLMLQKNRFFSKKYCKKIKNMIELIDNDTYNSGNIVFDKVYADYNRKSDMYLVQNSS